MNLTTTTAHFTDRDTVQIRMALGDIDKPALQPDIPVGYAELADPDTGWVWVDGGWAGRVVGDSFMPVATVTDGPLAPLFAAPDGDGIVRQAPVDDPDRWTATVNGDPVTIEVISRKSHISDSATVGNAPPQMTTTQNLFFDLAGDLTTGDVVTISFDDPVWDDITVTYAPGSTVSEAIHVNLTGFDPQDPVKVAYLSSWNGWRVDGDLADNGEGIGETYDGPRAFSVRDAVTGDVVYDGTTTLSAPADAPTNFWLNYAQTDVWAMDFSAVTTPGTYVVAVDGVGISQSFTIGDDHWDDIFATVFQGFYHQRSGVALTEDATDWTHPRSLHPDDGRVVVYASNVGIDETNNGYKDGAQEKFAALLANATDEILPDAWGGYHDAGDWDRRTQHIEAGRKLMELHEIGTDWSDALTARLPDAETGNTIPDLLDEAIFGMEFFARLQTEAGGVRGGIEGASYRSYGAASWDEPQPLYAYAPDIWTTWEFAAGAARLSRVLDPYDTHASAEWLDRATRAMDWAEARADTRASDDFVALASRNIAALDLYAATGDAAWHDIFRDTWVHDGQQEVPWNGVQYEAAALYARLDPALQDTALLAQAETVIIDRAEFLLDQGSRSPFGGLQDPYAPYGWGNTHQEPNDSAEVMVAAHQITGDQRYLDAIVDDLQYPLGANPLNMSYLTGIDGVRAPQNVLNGDAEAMGGAIPGGILVYGDYNIFDYGQDWFHGEMWNDLFPDPYRTPIFESFQGFYGFVPSTEYTVQQGISDLTFVAGYLASLQNDAPQQDGWLRLPAPDQGLPDAPDRIVVAGPDGATIGGSAGVDMITGGAGDDLLRAGHSDDAILGEAGRDRINAGTGDDLLFGGAGGDWLIGMSGDDALFGGAGDDILRGGDGADWLAGGDGNDRYYGQDGADVFAFGAGTADRDVVHFYQMGIDRIALEAALVGGASDAADWAAGRITTWADGTFARITLGTGDIIVLRSDQAMDATALTNDLILF